MNDSRDCRVPHPAFFSVARLAFLLFVLPSVAQAYSVLSHEAIVDALWENPIQKLLVKRFPDATPEQLADAHAFAYGGCIIQDMGYYPFASKLFSDLTHYVRSGDFVMALLKESQDVDEYAFALGALAHYAADISGHGVGVNVAVPLLYPQLRTRFGAIVTYWDNPLSHVRTEFGFDVLQVAQGRYAPDQYRGFVGFKVAKPVLERAFLDTYGLEMKDLFTSLDLALGTYRYTTSSVLPGMTKLAWQLKKDTVIKEIPGMTRKKFLFNLSRSSYEKDWGTGYQRPGIGGRFLIWFLRVVPKIGPFKALAFRAPTPAVEKLFMESFNATIEQYRNMLLEERTDRLDLPNKDFDTGKPTAGREYLGADLAYDKLVGKLADKKFATVTPEIRDNILKYYEGMQAPGPVAGGVRQSKKQMDQANADWAKTQAQLEQLKQADLTVAAVPAQ